MAEHHAPAKSINQTHNRMPNRRQLKTVVEVRCTNSGRRRWEHIGKTYHHASTSAMGRGL
jgi:hypothetical protein